MQQWLSKLALYLPGCLLVLTRPVDAMNVAVILAALTATSLWELSGLRWPRILVGAVWAGLTWLAPAAVFFIPLALFDSLSAGLWWLPLAAVLVFLMAAQAAPLVLAAVALLAGIAALLWFYCSRLDRQEKELRTVRDTTAEAALALERTNQKLLAAQEENARLATLTERSRIAREIHDNVGHLLARGMMQTGALITVNRQEELADVLAGLRDTLTLAMNRVRESVHDLHDDSIDLYQVALAAAQGFPQLKINLSYDIGEAVPSGVKTCFAAVVNEALSNTARHSNATRVNISLQEHPGFYQLSVTDNGTGAAIPSRPDGMGLANMRQRAQALGGRFTLRQQKGVGIHITIPREMEETR